MLFSINNRYRQDLRKIFHTVIVYLLITLLVFQGVLKDIRIYGLPLWICFFIPFVFYFDKYLREIKSSSVFIKGIYLYLITIIIYFSVSMFMSNVFGEDTVRRFFILVLGSFLLLSIFYEFKNNLDKFIWLISLLVLICAIYSIFQFHFDITFFEYFRRHYSYELNGVSITREWDVGASGTFSYPVPYGYFMASVYPLIYVHLIKIWRHQLSQYQKSLLVLY